ncbi:MAG TPA: YceI family protein [Anaerolineales bacterium]|nr:YceI family protein [Anaerolineales bacterium]
MRNLNLVIAVVLILVLAACAGPAAPATEAPAATQEPFITDPAAETEAPAATEPSAATEPPAATESPVETEAPTAEAAPGNPTVYVIVPGETTVSYAVGETFFNQNNRFNTAIGSTSQVQGEITVDPNNPQNATLGVFTIDISQFQSDSSRRDDALRSRFLESAQFPNATFTPTAIEGLPSSYSPGEPLTFQVTGDLTVREVTRPVTFDVTAQLENDTLTGVATTTLLMSDFGVGPIEIAGILGTEDEVQLTLDFVARP